MSDREERNATTVLNESGPRVRANWWMPWKLREEKKQSATGKMDEERFVSARRGWWIRFARMRFFVVCLIIGVLGLWLGFVYGKVTRYFMQFDPAMICEYCAEARVGDGVIIALILSATVITGVLLGIVAVLLRSERGGDDGDRYGLGAVGEKFGEMGDDL